MGNKAHYIPPYENFFDSRSRLDHFPRAACVKKSHAQEETSQ